MTVRHKEDGWSGYCHRCGDKPWHPKPMPTLAERVAAKAQQRSVEEAMRYEVRPPMPANFDVPSWPLAARVWLFKAGLFLSDIATLGAYYHEASKRVVLPVTEQGKLVYWQARLVEGVGSKYINPVMDKSNLVACYGEGSAIVLTEDILSAYRVGQEGCAWSLLGTKLSTPVLARLLKEGKPVLVWLDDDHGRVNGNPGQKAAATIMRTLSNVGIQCHNIVTSKDPKLLSRVEIKEVLCPWTNG
jgi:DNA primase